MVKIKLFEQNC